MPASTPDPTKETLSIFPCITPGCDYHVKFDLLKEPIPARTKEYEGLKGEVTVYLDCDNPVPHRNHYKIKI